MEKLWAERQWTLFWRKHPSRLAGMLIHKLKLEQDAAGEKIDISLAC
jgi:hypothetical protein